MTPPSETSKRKSNRGRVLIIDDDRAIRQALSVELGHSGFTVTTAEDGQNGLAQFAEGEFDVILLDIRLPDESGEEVLEKIIGKSPGVTVIMLTAHGDVQSAVRCLKQGAFEYLQKPTPLDELEATLDRGVEHTRLRSHNRELVRRLAKPTGSTDNIVGVSPALSEIRSLLARVAPTDVPVLITGGSGTGKEVVARALQAQSDRSNRPFFTLNCAALTETLVASELFGHEKGAFTGADEMRPGFFEMADGGTVFLDEIGEMSVGLQAKLLRVLQFGEFQRVGGRSTLKADVRVIAATNRDLAREMAEGRFREDLYHRISTITLAIPPLHERPEDLVPLMDFILADRLPRGIAKPRISEEALACLSAHDWPGNVRELENVLIRAAIVCDDATLEIRDLPEALRHHAGASAPPEVTMADATLDEVERRHILTMLDRTGGNKTEAARKLGITKRTLYNKLIMYGVHQPGGEE